MKMASFIDKIFGTYSEREIKKIIKTVDRIEALEEDTKALSDEELQNKTHEFRTRLKEGESLDDLLAEAFAVVREASVRVLGLRHFRVQLIGGIILHQGRIAEMKTGEGKTLVATLPAYLNALEGKGVHVVTVNDYLAQRDRDTMGKLYEFLGLTTGCVINGITNQERRLAYEADITYGTNNEFGFDYLRDNMVIYKEDMVQRQLNYCIVDEVDSILIDEARTPLIISGPGDESTDLYTRADRFVKTLTSRVVSVDEDSDNPFNLDREIKEETVDYLVDEKVKGCRLTEKGTAKAEAHFNIENLSDIENMDIAHHINQALKAHGIMKRDIDYVVQNGEILIVDEFTGRLMQGRRYSDGLHQAIEAKEGMTIKSESKTLATITFQNYFRMYNKLSGMTGTAMTEDNEFREIYNLDVVEIPTNEPVIREDFPDRVYFNEQIKFQEVVKEVKEFYEKGQPVLVGTISIEKSEILSKLLKRAGVKHEVLNAKQHEREAEIVAQAGRYKAVTIATNMAGRGTDIVLGGNPDFLAKNELMKKGFGEEAIAYADGFYHGDDEEILEARSLYNKYYEKFKEEIKEEKEKVIGLGGLHIIGTERHESRRIDNQLRGRSGRQGDPGSSRFYVALDDDLMRLVNGSKMQEMVAKFGMPEDEVLEHKMLTKSIESAQKNIEGRYFGIRKNVLKYDDVMNTQRGIIYKERRRVLEGENLREHIMSMAENLVAGAIEQYSMGMDYIEQWDLAGLTAYIYDIFDLKLSDLSKEDLLKLDREGLENKILERVGQAYEAKEAEFDEEEIREIERIILLQIVDKKWMDHIDSMDQLRQGIGLRAMGQQDPVIAYQMEGFEMFEAMNHSIAEDTVKLLYHIEKEEKLERKQVIDVDRASIKRKNESGGTYVKKEDEVGRNDPCPCGSGKKYKVCCGKAGK